MITINLSPFSWHQYKATLEDSVRKAFDDIGIAILEDSGRAILENSGGALLMESGQLVGKSAGLVIERLRVRIPAGAAGEFSSP